MPVTRSSSRRPAATLVESAVIFLVFLTMVLAMFDLGMAVFQSHVLTDAARQAVRQASVHGALASSLGSWGPESIGPLPASASNPACAVVANYLTGLDPAAVTVLVEWPDGGNAAGMRVQVTLNAAYPLIVPSLWGRGTIPLTAVSTTIIAH